MCFSFSEAIGAVPGPRQHGERKHRTVPAVYLWESAQIFELILDVLNKTIENYYKQEKLDGTLIRYMSSNNRKYLIFLLLCKNRIYQSTSNLNLSLLMIV